MRKLFALILAAFMIGAAGCSSSDDKSNSSKSVSKVTSSEKSSAAESSEIETHDSSTVSETSSATQTVSQNNSSKKTGSSTSSKPKDNNVIDGGGDKVTTVELPKANISGKTISVLTWGDKVTTEQKEFADKFKAAYGAAIKWEFTTYNDLATTLSRRVLANNAPDVAQLRGSGSEFPILCAKGVLQSIDGKIDYNTPLWKGVKTINENNRFKNKHYVARTAISSEVFVWYNRTLLRDVGGISVMPDQLYEQGKWDWNKLIEYAKACVNTKGTPPTYGLATDYGFLRSRVLGSLAVDFVTLKNDGTLASNLDSPRLAQALNFYRDLYNKFGIMAPLKNQSPDGEDITLFNSNQVAFMIHGATAASEKLHKAGTIGFVPAPRWPGEKDSQGLVFTLYGVPKGSKNMNGAIAFLNFARYDTINKANVDAKNAASKARYGITDKELRYMEEVKERGFLFTDVGGDSSTWLNRPFNELIGGKNWSTVLPVYKPMWQKNIDDYNKQVR